MQKNQKFFDRRFTVSLRVFLGFGVIVFFAGFLLYPAIISASSRLSLNEVDLLFLDLNGDGEPDGWINITSTSRTERGDVLVTGSVGGPLLDAGQAEPKTGSIAPFFTKEVQYWADDIDRWAKAYSLDPNLVATVMQIESCGHPGIWSPAGAQGLFQVMPFHFDEDENPLDPEINARRGINYLYTGMELAGGHSYLALAGYNGGHSLIGQTASRWPAETHRYLLWAMGILEDAQKGMGNSPMLKSWLEAGGSNLCRKAAQALDLP